MTNPDPALDPAMLAEIDFAEPATPAEAEAVDDLMSSSEPPVFQPTRPEGYKDAPVVNLPYDFIPRPHQRLFYEAMDNGIDRALLIWPRRSGKDLSSWQWLLMRAMKRVGTHLYVFPYKTDCRINFWEAMTHEGRPFLDYIPKEILKKPPNNTEMKIELINGSIIRMGGSDKYDSLRGGNPVTYVFSEWATSNPASMRVIQPIVQANDGAIVLNGTINGMNHMWTDYQRLKGSKRWYVDFKTADTLLDLDGNRYITDAILEKEREDGMSEEDIQREYYNDPNANSERFILIKQIGDMRKGNRLGSYPYNPDLPVHVSWDIGFHDSTALWFGQVENGWLTLIDYYESTGVLMEEYVKVLQEKPYVYGQQFLPHDIGVTEWGGGSRVERMEKLGITPCRLGKNGAAGVPKLGVWDGITLLRTMLKYTYMDTAKCQDGLNCLIGYQKNVDKATKLPTNVPTKNFAIHGADALRYMAVGLHTESLIGSGPGAGKKRGDVDGKRRYRKERMRSRSVRGWKAA